MRRILDDSTLGARLPTALRVTLDSAWRADHCIDHFMLSGWRDTASHIDRGGDVDEAGRCLIRMQLRSDEELCEALLKTLTTLPDWSTDGFRNGDHVVGRTMPSAERAR